MPECKWIDINKAIRMYRDEQLPSTIVSKVVGCCVQTLIVRLREHGVEIRSSGWDKQKVDFNVIKDEYENKGMSTEVIAKKHSMSASSVWERLTRGGVVMRDQKEELIKSITKIPICDHKIIRDRYKTNRYESCGDIADDYGVHKSTIANILRKYGIISEHKGARIKSYKGGITPLHTRIRHCEKAMVWRRICMERDDYTCQSTSRHGGKLEVHHIKLFSKIFEEFLSFNPDLDPENDCDQLFELS